MKKRGKKGKEKERRKHHILLISKGLQVEVNYMIMI